MKNKIKNIHFVGIGGSGMSGIAEVMHNLKFNVQGSDHGKSEIIQRLKKIGIMTVPSEIFNLCGKYIRVGFGRANFPEMIEILGQYLKTY